MSKGLTKEFWLEAFRAEGEEFRAAVTRPGIDLDAIVPSCPDWTVTDLIRHLGRVFPWISLLVTSGSTDLPADRPADHDRLDLTGAELIAWWTDRFTELLATFDATDLDAVAPNTVPQPKTMRFWLRRMALETAVHRWDAQMATGLAEPIEPRLAADGVTEVLEVFLPGDPRRAGLTVQGVVALHATDADANWYVRLRGSGLALLDTHTLFDDHDPAARAAATGTASDLLLALWGRVPFDVLQAQGDETLLRALKTG